MTVSRMPVAVIGAGPAGLMAAEALSDAGVAVHVFDAMPSAGRKFLLAGIGGLNLTHAEPFEVFVTRYAERTPWVTPWLDGFGPQALRDWAQGLGVETFVGSSRRVFPTGMKAAPLLRAWLHRLRGRGVVFHMRHRWNGTLAPAGEGWSLAFDALAGAVPVEAGAVVLALGGGSWPRLGSDGAWLPWLAERGVPTAPLRAANCGFDVRVGTRDGWSEHLSSRFAGQPLKSVSIAFDDGAPFERKGEFVLTATGIEGSLVYAASARLRDAIARDGQATLHLNLRPDLPSERVRAEVAHPRGSRSMSSHLKSRLNLGPVHTALLHELLDAATLHDPAALAAAIQRLPITLSQPRPLAEAISTAGGVPPEALDDGLMLKALPGVCCAGEMLDWEAPTGGYLLTACFASGRRAGQALAARLTGESATKRS